MSTPNSKINNNSNNNSSQSTTFNNSNTNNSNTSSSNPQSPFKGNSDHDAPLNTSPSRGAPGLSTNPQYHPSPNGMKPNYNNQRTYHHTNQRQPHQNQHQGHPPHYYQAPPYQTPPYFTYQPPPLYPTYQYPPTQQVIHHQGPPPPPNTVVPQQLGHPSNSPQSQPVPTQPPGVVVQQSNQGPHSPQHIQHTQPQGPHSPQNPRQYNPNTNPSQPPQQPTPILPQTSPSSQVIVPNPQGVVPPTNPQGGSRKPSSKSNNIPPRTHSAPPSSNDIQEHANSLQLPGKFVPDKSRQLNISSQHYIPAGVTYQQQPHFKPLGPPPPPPHEPYGYSVPYYPQPQYFDHYSYNPYYNQPIPGGVGGQPPINPTPYIKEQKSSSKLAIIDPQSGEQVNQSPPKSTPQPPPFSPPQFSLGNESIRQQKLTSSTDAHKPPTSTSTTSTPTKSVDTNKDQEKDKSAKEQQAKEKEDSTPVTTTLPIVKEEPQETTKATTVVSTSTTVETKVEEEKEKITVAVSEQPIPTQQQVETKVEEKIVESTPSVASEAKKEVETVKESVSEQQSSKTEDLIESVQKMAINDTEKPTDVSVEEGEISEEKDSAASANTSITTDKENLSSSTSSLSLRTTGEKITYSREFIYSLQPKGPSDVPNALKDLKSQMDASSGGLNRSGNKIGNQQQRGMNMSGNYPNQPQMKMYPNQMQMKNYPQQKNYNPNFNKYQQQIQQGFQQQQQGGFQQQQQQQQHGYGITTFQQPPVQPPIATQVNENRWVPTEVNKLDETQKILRKAKFILNKISPDKFDVLTQGLLELGVIESEIVHKGTIQLIFDKALNEAKFCTMYCNLCKRLFDHEKNKKIKDREAYLGQHPELVPKWMGLDKPGQDQFDDEHGFKPTFRKLLLMTCQTEYEKAHIEFESSTDILPDNATEAEKQDFEEKQYIKRKREFGLIKFIGELFNKEMLSEKILHGILIALMGELNKPTEIKLECFCKLLTITGKTLSTNEKAATWLTRYHNRMKDLTELPTLSQRLKFLIQNVIDLKNNNWVVKSDEAPKPLKEFENKGDEDRKSSTGVKTNLKNNFITNSFVNTKFGKPPGIPNVPPPSSKSPASSTIQPMIMKKPPGFNQQPNQQNYYGPNKNISMAQNLSNLNNANNSNGNLGSSGSGQSSANKKQQEAWDKLKQTFVETISEYLAEEDKSEYIACIEEYIGKQTQMYPYLISLMLTTSITGKDSEILLDLVIDLITEDKVFSMDDFKEGFSLFVQSYPDLYEDRPGAYKALGSVLYKCYQAKILPLSLIASQLSKQVDQISTFINQIFFEFISQFKNPKEAANVFNEQKISISDFFVKKDKKTILDLTTKYNKDLISFLDTIKEY
ncbi:eukaryotic translation initiation factor 4 gamma [Tieghemostelium lacteum]|uniref:Eukaryotic translation initiation factor 4 gamma n=1 Tax=Tieghemostelium lacteum TaxID=361077 RepID=A0A152A9Z7_TIELA|nr:eukaryotic translation initiation factor 4 gamma [Tieghemostelium lacteum]|eukprot:KYR03034.1 eukaryotic translation initiation factor 4 gamma [Tieghemostelium lacteum]